MSNEKKYIVEEMQKGYKVEGPGCIAQYIPFLTESEAIHLAKVFESVYLAGVQAQQREIKKALGLSAY